MFRWNSELEKILSFVEISLNSTMFRWNLALTSQNSLASLLFKFHYVQMELKKYWTELRMSISLNSTMFRWNKRCKWVIGIGLKTHSLYSLREYQGFKFHYVQMEPQKKIAMNPPSDCLNSTMFRWNKFPKKWGNFYSFV